MVSHDGSYSQALRVFPQFRFLARPCLTSDTNFEMSLLDAIQSFTTSVNAMDYILSFQRRLAIASRAHQHLVSELHPSTIVVH